MAVFEIQGPDGKTYEVDAPDMQSAISALRSVANPAGGSSADAEAVDEFGGKMRAAWTGFQNGGSYGLVDEGVGALSAAIGAMPKEGGGKTVFDYSASFGDRYRANRDQVRQQQAAAREAEPAAYTGGNIGGAGVQALAAAPMATGSSMLGTMGRGAGLGAFEGGLLGAGLADGEDVLKSAGKGAGIGGLLGGLAPAAVAAGGAVKNAVKDPITGIYDAVVGRANAGKANRAIANTLRASGKTPDQAGRAILQAAQEGQPEYRLMDALGVAGQRRASGIARAGGDSGAEIAEYLATRQAGQGERVAGFVDEGFGLNGSTAKKTTQRLTDARSEAADAAYGAARGNAAPVDVRGALRVIDDRIGGMKGSNVSGDGIDAKLSRYRSRLAADPAPNGEISRELSDFDRVLGVKQSIQDDIGAAVRAGRNNEARELGKVVQELDAALEGASDMYREANDGFREASRVIDAVDKGANMSRPSLRSADTTAQFSRMNTQQQQAARVGYGDSLLSRIEANASPTSNNAKPLQSPKRKAEAQAMAIDPNLYARRLSRENDMWETQNRALGGSRTADNLEDIDNLNSAASGLLGAARAAGNFQFGEAVAQIGSVLGPMARGQTDETRQLIARALMSDNPQAALEPVLRQYNATQQQRRFIEAIMRGATREPAVKSLQ